MDADEEAKVEAALESLRGTRANVPFPAWEMIQAYAAGDLEGQAKVAVEARMAVDPDLSDLIRELEAPDEARIEVGRRAIASVALAAQPGSEREAGQGDAAIHVETTASDHLGASSAFGPGQGLRPVAEASRPRRWKPALVTVAVSVSLAFLLIPRLPFFNQDMVTHGEISFVEGERMRGGKAYSLTLHPPEGYSRVVVVELTTDGVQEAYSADAKDKKPAWGIALSSEDTHTERLLVVVYTRDAVPSGLVVGALRASLGEPPPLLSQLREAREARLTDALSALKTDVYVEQSDVFRGVPGR